MLWQDKFALRHEAPGLMDHCPGHISCNQGIQLFGGIQIFERANSLHEFVTRDLFEDFHRVADLQSLLIQDRTSLQGATRGIAAGLLIGGGVGLIAGLKAGAGDCGKPSGMGCVVHDAVNAIAPIFGGIVGAGAGALIGGVIGSVRPGQHWVRISVPM